MMHQRAAVLVKPLAGGHSSGAPALPYGIGVSDVPNHAEHITSRGAPKDASTIRRETQPRCKRVTETCTVNPEREERHVGHRQPRRGRTETVLPPDLPEHAIQLTLVPAVTSSLVNHPNLAKRVGIPQS